MKKKNIIFKSSNHIDIYKSYSNFEHSKSQEVQEITNKRKTVQERGGITQNISINASHLIMLYIGNGCHSGFISDKTHVDYHKTFASIFSAYITSTLKILSPTH